MWLACEGLLHEGGTKGKEERVSLTYDMDIDMDLQLAVICLCRF